MNLEIQLILPPNEYSNPDHWARKMIAKAYKDMTLDPVPNVYGRKYEPDVDSWHKLFGPVPIVAFIDLDNSVLVDVIRNKSLSVSKLRKKAKFWVGTKYNPVTSEYVTPGGKIEFDIRTNRLENVSVLPEAFQEDAEDLVLGFLPIGVGERQPALLGLLAGLLIITVAIFIVK